MEFEQQGSARAVYGKGLLDRLSRDLTLRHGKGFSRSNVVRIRQFYLAYPKGAKASQVLGDYLKNATWHCHTAVNEG